MDGIDADTLLKEEKENGRPSFPDEERVPTPTRTWKVTFVGNVYHDVVVDAATEAEARELAGEHFDDNHDFYGNDGAPISGCPDWSEEPGFVRVIGP